MSTESKWDAVANEDMCRIRRRKRPVWNEENVSKLWDLGKRRNKNNF